MGNTASLGSQPSQDRSDLPLHPRAAQLLKAYVEADSDHRDAVVAGILEELNEALWAGPAPKRRGSAMGEAPSILADFSRRL